MVQLTVTVAAKAAIEEYCKQRGLSNKPKQGDPHSSVGDLSELETGSPIDHNDLVEISTFLLKTEERHKDSAARKAWRLDNLLKGASVYQAPPPPKPEPVSTLHIE